jgi:hypothetical protein
MSGYPTDQPGRPPDPRDLELARVAVAVPAVFLILNGLLGLVLVGLVSVPFVFDPDSMVNFFRDAIAKQPAGPEKAELEQDFAKFEAEVNQNRDQFVRQNAVMLSIRAGLDLLSIVGGFYMRSLSGYRMSVVGAAVAVIPLGTGCCVTGIPFGIWALVVLSRPDVKAAFAARRNSPPPDPDAQYMR